MSTVHPDETTLLRWVLGELPERRHVTLKKHTDRCRPCRDARDATLRLHERMAATGDGLAFAPGDRFETRPAAPTSASAVGNRQTVLVAMKEALARLDTEKGRLVSAINVAARDAAKEIELGDAAVRLACAHALEEAASGDPAKELSAFAEVLAERLADSTALKSEDGEGVVPSGQLRALASLVVGQWNLFSGALPGAEVQLAEAWTTLGSFEAPEHLVAWVETCESLRRSYLGRAVEGRLLAERALETFERYGHGRGVMRAKHARAVALYYAGQYREAHREFRTVLASKGVTTLDRAGAVSGGAFCLAARGQFHEAAKEYSAVRRKLRGDGAQVEQYLLQGEMKACLGTAGRWYEVRGGGPAFALPESGGSFAARSAGAEIVKLASDQGLEAATTRLAAIEADLMSRYALLYAAQVAMPKVSSDPAMYAELARALSSAARGLPLVKEKSPAKPVCREQLLGEAALTESSALNTLGRSREGLIAARQARVAFAGCSEDSFVEALADYFEGSAASFNGDYAGAWRLLIRCRSACQRFGQEHWTGRSEAALGTLLNNRAKHRSALRFFDSALQRLHPQRDFAGFLSTLTNRAASLLFLNRFEAAKAAYAEALVLARRMNSKIALLQIRFGLASIELKQGQYLRAMNSFQQLSEAAWGAGIEARGLSADLRVAECVGRLGRGDEMLTRVRVLRRLAEGHFLESDPPLRELFALADASDVTSELVSHVVEYLEARDRGVQTRYRHFKLVASGN